MPRPRGSPRRVALSNLEPDSFCRDGRADALTLRHEARLSGRASSSTLVVRDLEFPAPNPVDVVHRPDAVPAYWSRARIGSASAARQGDAGKGSAKYWVSCLTRPSVISMTLSEYVGTPS
jgi:hypothetical protein